MFSVKSFNPFYIFCRSIYICGTYAKGYDLIGSNPSQTDIHCIYNGIHVIVEASTFLVSIFLALSIFSVDLYTPAEHVLRVKV